MATLIHLDTHVVAWLFAGSVASLSETSRQAIEAHDLRISPMVLLELGYLYEIGRTTEPGEHVVGRLEAEIGLQICNLPFPAVAQRALEQRWTRDPFDRVIVSQALFAEAPLLTRDRTIHDNYPAALW